MTAAEGSMAALPDWRMDDTRNLRCNAKAERILGVSQYPTSYGIGKKRMGLNFSLSDLRDVLPSLARKASKAKFQMKISDSESIASSPSPTFDPSASTTSLNTTNSSPITAKRRPEQSQINSDAERLSQAETLRVKKVFMPTLEEQEQLANLKPLQVLLANAQPEDGISLGARKLSTTSLTPSIQATATKAPELGHSTPNHNVWAPQHLHSGSLNEYGNHVHEWLETAELDRRPSVATRSSSLPLQKVLDAARLSTSGESIQTLTSEVKDMNEIAMKNTSEWPLPAAKIISPPKLRRIHKSDLQLESFLSLSSDEEDSGDDGQPPSRRGSKRSSIGNSKSSPRSRTSKFGHQRQESTASSVIQLDSRPWIRPSTSSAIRIYPKRSLADIAASGAYRPDSGDSWETDIVVDKRDTQTLSTEEKKDDIIHSPNEECSTSTHPLWRSSTGSCDIDIRMSRPGIPLQTLPEEDVPAKTRLSKDETEDVLDVSSFPVPPRSRAPSIVPSIRVQHPDDSRKATASTEFPTGDTILLSPSTMSRSGSLHSENSTASNRSSQGLLPMSRNSEKRDVVLDLVRRKRTISNVPIYVTGLESSILDNEVEDGDVKSYVFSSIF